MHTSVRALCLGLTIALLAGCCLPLSVRLPAASEEWVRHDEFSPETRQVTWEGVRTRGLGVGFVRPEDRDTFPYDRPSNAKFRVAYGAPFTTFLILSTGFEEPYPVLISVLVDYRQVAFTLDGKSGLLHYWEIEPGAEMNIEIPIEVPIAEPGWHDVTVVLFKAPEEHPTDPQQRLPPKLGAFGKRTVVCAGDCTPAGRALPEAIDGAPGALSGARALLLAPGDGPPKERLLLTAGARGGAMVDLELWANNRDDVTCEYVVVPFLNYRQVEFAGSDRLLLRLPPDSSLMLPGRVRAPNSDGVHELTFLYVFDPFRDIDDTSDPFVQSDMRTGIIVGKE